MTTIDENTSLQEMAAVISQALEAAGIVATLAGGGAVTVYADNEYMSADLDFITLAGVEAISRALEPLDFSKSPGARQFEHPVSAYYVEFPPGPLAFGDTVVADDEAVTLQTEFGPLRVVTPTQIVMDRLSAYVHWHDLQSWDQAVMVVRRQEIDWKHLALWAEAEEIESDVVTRLGSRAAE